jgi:hypothetical protein
MKLAIFFRAHRLCQTFYWSTGGEAENWSQRITGQKFILQADDNFICELFYQSEFKPISKRQFITSEVIRILNILHVISK